MTEVGDRVALTERFLRARHPKDGWCKERYEASKLRGEVVGLCGHIAYVWWDGYTQQNTQAHFAGNLCETRGTRFSDIHYDDADLPRRPRP